jgi:predicted ATPase
VLFGLSVYHVNRAEPNAGRAAAEEMLDLAQAQGDAGAEIGAHRALGSALWHLGKLEPARAHLERVLALYSSDQHRWLTSAYSANVAVMALSFLAKTLFALGYPEQARARSQEALAEARELRHAHSLAMALATAGCRLHCVAHDAPAVGKHAEELIALCTEYGFPFYLTSGLFYRAWAMAEGGRALEAIPLLCEAFASSG